MIRLKLSNLSLLAGQSLIQQNWPLHTMVYFKHTRTLLLFVTLSLPLLRMRAKK